MRARRAYMDMRFPSQYGSSGSVAFHRLLLLLLVGVVFLFLEKGEGWAL